MLGGYLVLFPRNRVRVLTRGGVTSMPAIVVLGLWIVIQRSLAAVAHAPVTP